ncbi:MAG: hypothetical protein COB22_07830 [Cycloclasticus sp.]|nr:MAG: hypothetical protein COB22_07830 [Cycloclasticus sp.]
MNFWEMVTGNSTLTIQAGTNFWDHINNQKTGKLIITEGDYVADEITVECLVEELSDQEAELMSEQLAQSSAERVASVQETERIEDGSI